MRPPPPVPMQCYGDPPGFVYGCYGVGRGGTEWDPPLNPPRGLCGHYGVGGHRVRPPPHPNMDIMGWGGHRVRPPPHPNMDTMGWGGNRVRLPPHSHMGTLEWGGPNKAL